jgi:hypothetical protein
LVEVSGQLHTPPNKTGREIKAKLCVFYEDVWGSGGKAPSIPIPGTRWSSQPHPPAVLPPGKEPLRHPQNRRLGGNQSRSGCGNEESRTTITTAIIIIIIIIIH